MAHGGATESAFGEIDRELGLRLQTFDHRWTGKKETRELASAGFTFTGIGDKVECGQCGLKLLNWTSTDDPLHEHATRRPLCPFINSRYRQLGQSKPPKHPQYQQLQARLDSFVAWPGRYVPKTPEKLAAAGFFYIGSADRVTCFQCGITLRDWEEEHDPVTEHQRYSENCQFINSISKESDSSVERPDTSSELYASGTSGDETECLVKYRPEARGRNKGKYQISDDSDLVSSRDIKSEDRAKVVEDNRRFSTDGKPYEKEKENENRSDAITTSSITSEWTEESLCGKRRLTSREPTHGGKRVQVTGICKKCRETERDKLFTADGQLDICPSYMEVSTCIICSPQNAASKPKAAAHEQ